MFYPPVFLLVCLAGFVMTMGMGIGDTLLPIYAAEVGATSLVIGMIVSSFWATRTAIEVPSGMISDRFGRRLPVIVGLLLSAVGSFVCGLPVGPAGIIIARGIFGVGSALFFCTVMTFVVDLLGSQRRGRSFGTWEAVISTGSLLGTSASGYVVYFLGFKYAFFGCAMLMIVSCLIFALPKSLRRVGEQPTTLIHRNVAFHFLRNRTFLVVVFVGFVRFFVEQGVIRTVFPIYANQGLRVEVPLVGILMALREFGFVLASFVFGFLSDRIGRKPLLLGGLTLTALSIYLLGAVELFSLLSILMFMSGFASGAVWITLPILVIESVDVSARGMAMGVFRTSFDAGAIFGPILAMSVFTLLGAGSCFSVGSLLILVNLLPILLFLRMKRL